jgi:hypothetical protein
MLDLKIISSDICKIIGFEKEWHIQERNHGIFKVVTTLCGGPNQSPSRSPLVGMKSQINTLFYVGSDLISRQAQFLLYNVIVV